MRHGALGVLLYSVGERIFGLQILEGMKERRAFVNERLGRRRTRRWEFDFAKVVVCCVPRPCGYDRGRKQTSAEE